MEIIKKGKFDTYEFTCPVCGSVFRASTDECDRVGYVMGIPQIEVKCPVCCIGNCSKVLGDCVNEDCAYIKTATISSTEIAEGGGICTDNNISKFINM